MLIPENFIDFLYWFKDATETSWAKKEQEINFAPLNAKWVGMKEAEIAEVEKKYQITFPPDHRDFLKILHTIDLIPQQEYSFFFNWLEDEQTINDRLNWPDLSLSYPGSTASTTNNFIQRYHSAPKLIPVFGHRFIISEPCKQGNPILSVMGSDIIIYG